MHHKIKFTDQRIELEHISISYPQILLKHKKLQNRINAIILEKISSFVDKQAKFQNNDSLLYCEYNVTLATQKLLSVMFDFYLCDEKSSVSHNILKSLTLDIKNAYIYSFDDLFIEDSNYQNVINKFILEYVRDNSVPIIEELANINENRSFYLTEDSLVVYYNFHKNSTYSSNYCVPQFHIPLNSIRNIINFKALPLES